MQLFRSETYRGAVGTEHKSVNLGGFPAMDPATYNASGVLRNKWFGNWKSRLYWDILED